MECVLFSVDIKEGIDVDMWSPPPEQDGCTTYGAVFPVFPGDIAKTTADTIIRTKKTPMMPVRKGLARGARRSFSACLCARAKKAAHKTMTESR